MVKYFESNFQTMTRCATTLPRSYWGRCSWGGEAWRVTEGGSRVRQCSPCIQPNENPHCLAPLGTSPARSGRGGWRCLVFSQPFLGLLTLLLAISPAIAQSGPVRYRIDLNQARQQLIGVTMELPGVAPGTTHVDLHLPVWRPGLYQILDQAGTVRDVSATDARGQALEVGKTEKSTWRVRAGEAGGGLGEGTLRIAYTVWAGSLENRTRHADDTHAYISPAAVMMYSPGWRALPVDVTIDAPAPWGIATGMEPVAGDPRHVHAADYDVLVDSPIEAGRHHRVMFEAAGVPHEVIVWTGEPEGLPQTGSVLASARLAKLPADLAKIVETQKAIFGRLPYSRYVFLVHCYPGGRGGTEHLNSTIVQCAPAAFHDDEAYSRFLQLCAHETFHTWNVKRFRPAGLVPYDYQKENYTDALWLAEGTTSYYEDVTLMRAGLMKASEFLKALGKSIHDHRQKPGRALQSLTESSFDSWVKHNRRTADAPNSTVSFYDEGALVSMALDLRLREVTGGQRSLDDAMRGLYERFPTPAKGYTTRDIVWALDIAATLPGDINGSVMGGFYEKHIQGRESPDFEALLATVGLKLSRAAVKQPESGSANAGVAVPASKARAGLVLRDQAGLAQVETVLADGPAAAAGIVPGDQVLAMDGRRVRVDGWDKALERAAPGATVTLLVFRHDAVRELAVTLSEEPRGAYEVTTDPQATDEAKGAFTAWTGLAWPGKSKGEPKETNEETAKP